jgi:serine/threonine-protein kinase
MQVSGELVLADRHRSGAVGTESLAARIDREARIPAAETVRIAARCAGALHEIHSTEVVHGDIRPSNIVLTRTGRANLVGFRGTTATATYLAPERARGVPASVASDLYSLGVILYRMLAGRLPFCGDDRAALLAAHAAAIPDQLPADVPPALARLCLQLMAKDPGDRPASAEHVLGRLKSPRILDPWPAWSGPRPVAESVPGWAAARPVPVRDRVVTVTPGQLVLLTAAAAAAICLASVQPPLASGSGRVQRVQTSVSATTSRPVGTPPSAAAPRPSVTRSPAPPAAAAH